MPGQEKSLDISIQNNRENTLFFYVYWDYSIDCPQYVNGWTNENPIKIYPSEESSIDFKVKANIDCSGCEDWARINIYWSLNDTMPDYEEKITIDLDAGRCYLMEIIAVIIFVIAIVVNYIMFRKKMFYFKKK